MKRADTHRVYGNGPLARLVEELLIVPVRMCGLQLSCTEVVVAEPENSERQEKWILVTARITNGCK